MADFMSVMSPGHFGEFQRGLAAERPATFNTDEFFNKEPPSAMVTFIIGGVLWVISFGMFISRVQMLRKRKDGDLHGYDLCRGLIACAIDNDQPYYTITSFAAISFLFLGGIQTDYQTTLIVMVCYYAVVSFGDSLRVLLAYWSYESLSEVFLFSDMDTGLKEKREEDTKEKDLKFETMEIQPTNIYEDMGRERTIVVMIFLTQIILVSFVCLDIYNADTVRCLDKTPDCPVGGTAGSYGFYCMGIFQACVYLLGPKTNFGMSEQNPGFWLILLLASKKNGARLLWENPVKDPAISKNRGTLKDSNGNLILDANGNPKFYFSRNLNKNDFTMWRRFFMSYLVNGVAFHILVHALPIQIASQTSYTGVVFRAVGMLYLVDLDDTKGFRLTITEKDEEENKKDDDGNGEIPAEGGADVEPDKAEDEKADAKKDDDMEEMRPPGQHTPLMIDSTGAVTPILETQQDQEAMVAEANEILNDAEEKLKLLRANGPSTRAGLGALKSSSRDNQGAKAKPPINASSRINIGFGCNSSSGAGNIVGLSQGGAGKNNMGQLALLQASTDMDAAAANNAGDGADGGGAGAGADGGGGYDTTSGDGENA